MGLVEEEHVGPPDQGAADRQPLALPPDNRLTQVLALPFQAEQGQHVIHGLPGRVEGAEQVECLADRQAIVELRFLQVNPELLAQGGAIRRPAPAEYLDLGRVRIEQPLEDLDGGRLAGPVRPQQPEALSGRDIKVEPATATSSPYRLTRPLHRTALAIRRPAFPLPSPAPTHVSQRAPREPGRTIVSDRSEPVDTMLTGTPQIASSRSR